MPVSGSLAANSGQSPMPFIRKLSVSSIPGTGRSERRTHMRQLKSECGRKPLPPSSRRSSQNKPPRGGDVCSPRSSRFYTPPEPRPLFRIHQSPLLRNDIYSKSIRTWNLCGNLGDNSRIKTGRIDSRERIPPDIPISVGLHVVVVEARNSTCLVMAAVSS